MSKFAASLAIATALLSASAVAETAKPTVVLVHGAFADSSSWNGVTRILQKDGYNVVAAANPLRSVSTDAAYISSVVNNIKGPVVLVGHSYGGQVITNAARETKMLSHWFMSPHLLLTRVKRPLNWRGNSPEARLAKRLPHRLSWLMETSICPLSSRSSISNSLMTCQLKMLH
nr:alpha/beta hydrolase [Klebsiella pneumoniae]